MADEAQRYARAEQALLAATGHGYGYAFGGRWSRLVAGLPLAIKPVRPIASVSPVKEPGARRPRLAGSRLMARIASFGLVALLVLPYAAETHHAEAGKKSKAKTITRTFSSDGQIDIPDAGTEGAADPYPSTIDVDFFEKFKRAKIKDIDLTLIEFDHTFPDNVDVMLTLGPRRAIVMSDAGGSTDVQDATLTFDDEAATQISTSDELTSGTVRPANHTGDDPFPAPAPAPNANVALTAFNGAKPDGRWRLFIHDDANNDTGGVDDGWTLEITAKVKKEKNKKKKRNG